MLFTCGWSSLNSGEQSFHSYSTLCFLGDELVLILPFPLIKEICKLTKHLQNISKLVLRTDLQKTKGLSLYFTNAMNFEVFFSECHHSQISKLRTLPIVIS